MKATPVFTAGRVVYGSAYHVFCGRKTGSCQNGACFRVMLVRANQFRNV